MHVHWILMRPTPEARRAESIWRALNSGKCIGFVLFHSNYSLYNTVLATKNFVLIDCKHKVYQLLVNKLFIP